MTDNRMVDQKKAEDAFVHIVVIVMVFVLANMLSRWLA